MIMIIYYVIYVDNYPMQPNPQPYLQPPPNYGTHQYPHIEPQVSLTRSYIILMATFVYKYIM